MIGYCLAGVLALLLAAGHPELPIRNLITLTTPCDYREMGFMSKMLLEGRLDADDVIDPTGLVPASAMDEGFQSLKPTDRVVQQVNLFQNLWNDQWVEGFLGDEPLGARPGPVPRRGVPPDGRRADPPQRAARGRDPVRPRQVRLEDIKCPFLNVYCEQDTIVPAPASEPLVGLVGSPDARELRLQSGHVGLVAGRSAAKVARPQIAEWIAGHSEQRSRAAA